MFPHSAFIEKYSITSFGNKLESMFRKAWTNIACDLFEKSIQFSPPEIGYLTNLEISHTELLEAHGIVAIPASIFGIKSSESSILSCLSVVKNELFN
jgi:hypothetical protein